MWSLGATFAAIVYLYKIRFLKKSLFFKEMIIMINYKKLIKF